MRKREFWVARYLLVWFGVEMMEVVVIRQVESRFLAMRPLGMTKFFNGEALLYGMRYGNSRVTYFAGVLAVLVTVWE